MLAGCSLTGRVRFSRPLLSPGGGVQPVAGDQREQQQEAVRGPLRGLCTSAQPQPDQRGGAGAVPHGGADEHLRLLQPGEQQPPPPLRSARPKATPLTVSPLCRPPPPGDGAPLLLLLSRNQNSCQTGQRDSFTSSPFSLFNITSAHTCPTAGWITFTHRYCLHADQAATNTPVYSQMVLSMSAPAPLTQEQLVLSLNKLRKVDDDDDQRTFFFSFISFLNTEFCKCCLRFSWGAVFIYSFGFFLKLDQPRYYTTLALYLGKRGNENTNRDMNLFLKH